MEIEAFAPAKLNLTLHVTGRRADGLHRLDSLVAFADVGDRIRLRPAPTLSLTVEGPMAARVPAGEDNLVVRAARLPGRPAVAIALEKHLPPEAGLGGGSSDAAATLRGLRALGAPPPTAEELVALGADVPVCHLARPARMGGIGEILEPVALPPLHLVLVNPGVPVPTGAVFARLERADNPPMPADLPRWRDARELARWLAGMRNDLETAARQIAPPIDAVLRALRATPGCLLARMSGSGASCLSIHDSAETAAAAAERLRHEHGRWWIRAARLWQAPDPVS